MTTGWGQPVAAPEREAFSPGQYVNCTVGIMVLEVLHNQASKFGGFQDVVRANVIVIHDPVQPQRIGEEFGSVRLFNGGVVDRVKDYVGQTVIGRITAQPGQNPGNPAIIFTSPTPEELTYGQQFLAGRSAPAAAPAPQAPPFAGPPASPAPPPANGGGSWGGTTTQGPPPPPSRQQPGQFPAAPGQDVPPF